MSEAFLWAQHALRVTVTSLALPDTEWVGDLPTPTEVVTRPWYEEANRRSGVGFDTRVSVDPEDHHPTLGEKKIAG